MSGLRARAMCPAGQAGAPGLGGAHRVETDGFGCGSAGMPVPEMRFIGEVHVSCRMLEA
jgi:hypothetical protein